MHTALEDELDVGRRLRHFRKDETIYCEGDSSRTWFEVVDGIARTCCFFADGQRQLTGFHYAGDVFGLENRSRTESAQAVTDLVCSRVSKPDPCDEAASFHISGYRQALCKALENARRYVSVTGRRTAAGRFAAFLLQTSERLNVEADVELLMSRTDIADYLGLTIHTLSRTMTLLCEDNLIALQGFQHCRIVDRPGLVALARGASGNAEARRLGCHQKGGSVRCGNSPFGF
jgi:CRP-like cAMP-binding protein